MIESDAGAARGAAVEKSPRPALVVALPGRFRLGLAISLAAAVLLIGAAAWGTGYRYHPITQPAISVPGALPDEPAAVQKELSKLRSRRKSLETSLRQKSPKDVHLVIDQTLNRLYIKKDDQILLEAKCSAGSGMVLEEEGGKNRRWVFDTPRGQFRVLNRIDDPVWKKPDWAFVEEGKPIPKDPNERFEYGTLGEYALYFGNGYMIHGTLYERLLGRNVTHGCIRLGKEDLRKVWAAAPLGTPIYIY